MKKYLVILFVILPFLTSAKTTRQPAQKETVMDVINAYCAEEGIDVVRIGKLGTFAIKKIIRLSADASEEQEIKDALKIIHGINSLLVVDYSDCREPVRNSISGRISKVLGSTDLLMEVKDGTDVMKMYGIVNGNSSEVRDFILFSPEDCSIICLFGSISMDAISMISDR